MAKMPVMEEQDIQRWFPDENEYPGLLGVMISCEIREQTREATIKQFTDLGIEVLVVLSPCAPASFTENCRVAGIAVRQAFREGKHALFLEDDLIVNPYLFPLFLERALEADEPTYFYLHDQEGRMIEFYGKDLSDIIHTRTAMRHDLYRLRTRRHTFGTQCVLLPYWFIEPIVKYDQIWRSQKSFDVFLWQYLARPSINMHALVALPHPIQHLHDRTGRGKSRRGAVKKSMSFGMKSFSDGPNVKVAWNPVIHFWAEDIEDYEHLRPIWRELNPIIRGYFMAPEPVIEFNAYDLLVYPSRKDCQGTTFYLGNHKPAAPGRVQQIGGELFEEMGVPRLDGFVDQENLLERGVILTEIASLNKFRTEIRRIKPQLSAARGNTLYSLARPHFLKYGLKVTESVYDVLASCREIHTDNLTVAREAMTLGREVIMIDAEKPCCGFPNLGLAAKAVATWIERQTDDEAEHQAR
jgi:hypothetical protein